jgi:hypothetical protein
MFRVVPGLAHFDSKNIDSVPCERIQALENRVVETKQFILSDGAELG